MGPCRPEDKGNSKPVPVGSAGDGAHGVEHDDVVSNNPQPPQLEGPETIDPQQEHQEAWATAEGYTPLADWNLQQQQQQQQQYGNRDGDGMSTWMVSVGPVGGNSSSDDDSDDEVEELEARSYRGAFFVNPSAFAASHPLGDGIEEDEKSIVEETGGELSATDRNRNNEYSIVAGSDFEDIAARALRVLEDEYQQSLARERISFENEDSGTNNSELNDGAANKCLDDDDDIKIIAAAFDERQEEEMRVLKEQGGAPVNRDGLSSCATTNVASILPPFETTATKKKDEKLVDTDAVKRAINELAIKNQGKPFLQKFAAWQQKQQQEHKKRDTVVPTHELIPPTPRRAFARSTVKAKQATANLTRSATLAEAIVRILLAQSSSRTVGHGNNQSLLLIDVVGVDHVECGSIKRIQATFRPIVRWLGTKTDLPYQHVHFRLVGRDLFSVVGAVGVGDPVDLLSTTSTMPGAVQKATATCHPGLYHEFLGAGVADINRTTPALLMAFNAGIWGYQEWETTIRHLAQRKSAIPMVITAYTLEECQEDHDVVEKVTRIVSTPAKGDEACCAKVLWEPQENPFGSKMVRETKSSNHEYRENAYWQAWLLGGDKVDA